MKARLEAWREAERRRDSLAAGSPEWEGADQEVRRADIAYLAEVARVAVRYTEAEFQAHGGRATRWDFFGSLASSGESAGERCG